MKHNPLLYWLLLGFIISGLQTAAAQSVTPNGMVRRVYFLPKDRPARPQRITALQQLIQDAQEFYADDKKESYL